MKESMPHEEWGEAKEESQSIVQRNLHFSSTLRAKLQCHKHFQSTILALERYGLFNYEGGAIVASAV